MARAQFSVTLSTVLNPSFPPSPPSSSLLLSESTTTSTPSYFNTSVPSTPNTTHVPSVIPPITPSGTTLQTNNSSRPGSVSSSGVATSSPMLRFSRKVSTAVQGKTSPPSSSVKQIVGSIIKTNKPRNRTTLRMKKSGSGGHFLTNRKGIESSNTNDHVNEDVCVTYNYIMKNLVAFSKASVDLTAKANSTFYERKRVSEGESSESRRRTKFAGSNDRKSVIDTHTIRYASTAAVPLVTLSGFKTSKWGKVKEMVEDPDFLANVKKAVINQSYESSMASMDLGSAEPQTDPNSLFVIASKTAYNRSDAECDLLVAYMVKLNLNFISVINSSLHRDIARNIQYRKFKRNTYVFKQGEIGSSAYIVISGSAIVLVNSDNWVSSEPAITKDDIHDAITHEISEEHEARKPKNRENTRKIEIVQDEWVPGMKKVFEYTNGIFLLCINYEVGGCFGDVSLIKANNRRNATILSGAHGLEVLVIYRDDYIRTLKQDHLIQMENRASFFKKIKIFDRWPKSRLMLLASAVKEKRLNKNSWVIHPTEALSAFNDSSVDSKDSIIFLVEGEIVSYITESSSGTRMEFTTMTAPEYLGEERFVSTFISSIPPKSRKSAWKLDSKYEIAYQVKSANLFMYEISSKDVGKFFTDDVIINMLDVYHTRMLVRIEAFERSKTSKDISRAIDFNLLNFDNEVSEESFFQQTGIFKQPALFGKTTQLKGSGLIQFTGNVSMDSKKQNEESSNKMTDKTNSEDESNVATTKANVHTQETPRASLFPTDKGRPPSPRSLALAINSDQDGYSELINSYPILHKPIGPCKNYFKVASFIPHSEIPLEDAISYVEKVYKSVYIPNLYPVVLVTSKEKNSNELTNDTFEDNVSPSDQIVLASPKSKTFVFRVPSVKPGTAIFVSPNKAGLPPRNQEGKPVDVGPSVFHPTSVSGAPQLSVQDIEAALFSVFQKDESNFKTGASGSISNDKISGNRKFFTSLDNGSSSFHATTLANLTKKTELVVRPISTTANTLNETIDTSEIVKASKNIDELESRPELHFTNKFLSSLETNENVKFGNKISHKQEIVLKLPSIKSTPVDILSARETNKAASFAGRNIGTIKSAR